MAGKCGCGCSSKAAASAVGGARTILCVDDDPDFLEFLSLVLAPVGYKVVTAASAADGLKRAKDARPDLIIADLMMEDVDSGLKFAEDLKTAGNKAPIIMTSSVGDGLAQRADTGELGLAGVLQKPVDKATLLGLVKAKLK